MSLDIHKEYKNATPVANIRQKWDMLALDTRDTVRIPWALENHFEPFAITTTPQMNPLTRSIETTSTLWMKRPSHEGETEINVPEDKKETPKEEIKNVEA